MIKSPDQFANSQRTNRPEPRQFLAFRKEKAKELDEEICDPYYNGEITAEEIQNRMSLSQKDAEAVQFVLDSFTRPKTPGKLTRKDGSHIAVHSLQLFLTARDVYKIEDPEILSTLLLHDIAEDTTVTLADIAEKFGEREGSLAAVMTEQRGGEEAKKNRIQEVVEFAAQIQRGGYATATAEIIDRMDDVADLAYLVDKLEQNPDDAPLQNQTKDKLTMKFGKCSYTVEKMKEVAGPQGEELAADFEKILECQLEDIKSRCGIIITREDIESEVRKYYDFETAEEK